MQYAPLIVHSNPGAKPACSFDKTLSNFHCWTCDTEPKTWQELSAISHLQSIRPSPGCTCRWLHLFVDNSFQTLLLNIYTQMKHGKNVWLVMHLFRTSPSSWVAVTSCHYSPLLTSSACDNGDIDKNRMISRYCCKQFYKNLHCDFVSHL
jgi:hypothetical protein